MLRMATPGWFCSVAPIELSSCLVSSCPDSTLVAWNASNWLRASALTVVTSSKCSSGSIRKSPAGAPDAITSLRRDE